MFRKTTADEYPQNLGVFDSLVSKLCRAGGFLFYYADEKPIGTPKQTNLDSSNRERWAMKEAINRLCRHADKDEKNILVMIDQINEKTRSERLPIMYGHIFGRTTEFPEMKRIVEPPMHIDSVLSTNIQFADWVAAAVSRGLDYQLIRDSQYRSTATAFFPKVERTFTYESKIHLHQKSIDDIVKESIFERYRPLYTPSANGQRINDDPDIARKMMRVAQSSRHD